MNKETQMSRRDPLVTIGLMTYNYPIWGGRDLFLKAMDSLVSQDYDNKEILILDDCSQDEIVEDCLRYSQRYPFIRVFRNEKNVGGIENFKELIGKIEGQLFLWACPDDVYDTTFISKCIECFTKNSNTAIVATGLKIFHENGEIHIHRYHDFLSHLPLRKIARNAFRGQDSRGKFVHYSPMIHSSMIKAEHIEKIFYEKMFLFAEELWFLNTLVYGKMSYIDELLYFRYASSASHHEKDPELDSKLSFRLSKYIGYLWDYLKYFWSKKDITFKQKLTLMVPLTQAVRYRILLRAWNLSKYTLLQCIRKLGFMKYDAQSE